MDMEMMKMSEVVVPLNIYDRVWIRNAKSKYVITYSEGRELHEFNKLTTNIVKLALAIIEKSIDEDLEKYVCIKINKEMREDIKDIIEGDEE